MDLIGYMQRGEGCIFKDDEDQVAFWWGFPYVETEDQLRSIDEIKRICKILNQWIDLVGDVMVRQKLLWGLL